MNHVLRSLMLLGLAACTSAEDAAQNNAEALTTHASNTVLNAAASFSEEASEAQTPDMECDEATEGAAKCAEGNVIFCHGSQWRVMSCDAILERAFCAADYHTHQLTCVDNASRQDAWVYLSEHAPVTTEPSAPVQCPERVCIPGTTEYWSAAEGGAAFPSDPSSDDTCIERRCESASLGTCEDPGRWNVNWCFDRSPSSVVRVLNGDRSFRAPFKVGFETQGYGLMGDVIGCGIDIPSVRVTFPAAGRYALRFSMDDNNDGMSCAPEIVVSGASNFESDGANARNSSARVDGTLELNDAATLNIHFYGGCHYGDRCPVARDTLGASFEVEQLTP